jgi:flavodoxin
MKSTIVIYGHESELTKADAKHIAYHIGAQTTCPRHIDDAMLSNVENFILCLPSFAAEKAENEWREYISTFRNKNIKGKYFILYIPSGSPSSPMLGELRFVLSQRGARILSQIIRPQHYTIDEWISAVSPSL